MAPSWESLLPPILAIGLALALRNVLIALGIAIVAGSLIAASYNPGQAVSDLALSYGLSSLSGASHLGVLAFSLLLGGMIGVMGSAGGPAGLAKLVTRTATTKVRGQVATWVLGLVIFFDDYVNSLIVGSSMRPLYDKLRISREKLAFLVDATAAPVVSLALVSSWIGVEIGYIGEQYAALGLRGDAYVVFIQTLPYRFYPWFMLLFGLTIALTGRDFGPMLAAERGAASGELAQEIEKPGKAGSPEPEETGPIWAAVVPILVLLAGAILGMLADGLYQLANGGDPISFRAIFSRARSYVALVGAATLGNLAALLIARFARGKSTRELGLAWRKGAKTMLLPCGILLLAWTLSSVCGELKSAQYLVQLIGDGMAPGLLPAAVFFLAALTSFATGTSWGTMAILFPLVVPLAHGLAPGNEGIMLGAISSILAGAVWGDHCSPISDTTIMSSLASGCDHMAHVKTQLPYALLVGVVSILVGDIATGLGWYSPAAGLALGALAILLLVRILGRKSEPT
jgi:Na+/H+ antiporter NhaC